MPFRASEFFQVPVSPFAPAENCFISTRKRLTGGIDASTESPSLAMGILLPLMLVHLGSCHRAHSHWNYFYPRQGRRTHVQTIQVGLLGYKLGKVTRPPASYKLTRRPPVCEMKCSGPILTSSRTLTRSARAEIPGKTTAFS